jgi:hypothetical protein
MEYVRGGPIGDAGAVLLYAPFSFLAPALYQVFAGIGAWRSASSRHVIGILARVCIFFSLSVTLLLIGSMFFYAAFQG